MIDSITDDTIVYFVSPDGVVLHLSGGAGAGAQGFVLGEGPDGLGHVESAAIFDKSARQIGEEYVDTNFDHGELDLPIYVFGDTVDEFHRRRDWLRTLLSRRRQGWIVVGTSLGLRWIAVRRGSIKPAYGSDPAADKGAAFDVLLYADHPMARAADDTTPEWRNPTGASKASGSMALYPGPEVAGWPKFALTGPGVLQLIYDGEAGATDLTFPELKAGETLMVDTEYGMQELEARDAKGNRRNLWPLMKLARSPSPIPAGEVTIVRFSISKASAKTKLWGTVPQFQEGLL
ncbi:hypothetical protein A6411_10640 [Prescottella equi]|uniref:phage tail domain-containing protein n=1 Tax=Rhodococcus hoagii TaxID=43767 RepID=UPI0009BE785C|nr:phage tail domain-containing protein [Prescottella equi]OQQ32255.1 hypothetical protein A6411_10640 [Prescottella equi]